MRRSDDVVRDRSLRSGMPIAVPCTFRPALPTRTTYLSSKLGETSRTYRSVVRLGVSYATRAFANVFRTLAFPASPSRCVPHPRLIDANANSAPGERWAGPPRARCHIRALRCPHKRCTTDLPRVRCPAAPGARRSRGGDVRLRFAVTPKVARCELSS